MEYSARNNTLVTFYLLLILLGGASAAVGLWIHFYVVEDHNILTSFFDADSFHKELYSRIAYARIAVGSLSLFVALCAMFCCVKMTRRWQVALYTLYILFLICAEIMGIVVPVLYKDSSLDDWENEFQNGMRYKATTLDIDGIQKEHKCCGSSGPDDYTSANLVVPDSCCPNNDCDTSVHQDGCLDPAYGQPVMKELNKMIFIALAFCVVEVLALIMVLCLTRSESSNNKEMDNSSQKTLRSSHKSSTLEGYGKVGPIQGLPTKGPIFVHSVPPNDPLFYQDHMKKYQQRASAMYAGSDMSNRSSAVYQAKQSAPRTVSENTNFNAHDPNNDALFYQDHMKRYPSPARASYGEDQAAIHVPIS